MDTDLIVNQYFEKLFPNSDIRADNLCKLGHFLETPETILIIQGYSSTGKMTLFRILTLLGNNFTQSPNPLFMGDKLFQFGDKLICITQSMQLVRPFPNLKPIIVKCEQYMNQKILPIIINQHRITNSLQRLLALHARAFERYDLVPKYESAPLIKNRWLQQRMKSYLYTKLINQSVNIPPTNQVQNKIPR
jgi:hypothetical protein